MTSKARRSEIEEKGEDYSSFRAETDEIITKLQTALADAQSKLEVAKEGLHQILIRAMSGKSNEFLARETLAKLEGK